MVDHDRLFKQLLSTFFLEFLQIFAPELARDVEAGSTEFLDKETFTDAVAGKRHVVDLLVRVRVRGAPGCILVHVENQAAANAIAEFPRRMLAYFAALEARHGVPIYPVAVLSFDRPRAPRADCYEMVLPGLKVLQFRFRQVQLNRLLWRDFVRRPNPVAAALMSRMRIEPHERPRVKLECLRLLATLRLDPGKARLIAAFVDTYLNLRGRERRLFTRKVRAMPANEREGVMEFTMSWHEEGRQEGAAQIALRQLRRRFGTLPDKMSKRIESLRITQLERLAEDLLDFRSAADLDVWLAARKTKRAAVRRKSKV